MYIFMLSGLRIFIYIRTHTYRDCNLTLSTENHHTKVSNVIMTEGNGLVSYHTPHVHVEPV